MIVIYYDGDPSFGVLPPGKLDEETAGDFVASLVEVLNSLEVSSGHSFEWYASELEKALTAFGFTTSDLIPADADQHWRVDI